jgi:hypothetical protein
VAADLIDIRALRHGRKPAMALMMRSTSAPSPTVTLRPNFKDVAPKVPPGLLVKSLVGRVGLEPTTGGL